MGPSDEIEDEKSKAWIASLTGNQRHVIRVIAIGVIALAGLAIAYFVYTANMNAQLLRLDADELPTRLTLVRFAVAEAAPLYARDCASCHGRDLRGNAELGAPNLTDRDWIYGQGRIGEIEQTISYGIRSHNPRARNLADMPGFAKARPDERVTMYPLSPPQIEDLVSYLFSIEKRGPKNAAAARGESLFLGSGGCFDCHGNDAAGDSYVGAVNLTDNVWLYGDGSFSSVFRSIAKGHAGVCPAWIGKIKPAGIRALAVYIYVRSHPTKVLPGGAS